MTDKSARTQKVSDVIQRELARVLQREFKDPRISLVTITEVVTARDLSSCKVFVTLMSEENLVEQIAILNKAQGFFRSQLAKRLTLRLAPRLKFIHDDSISRGLRMDALIDKALQS